MILNKDYFIILTVLLFGLISIINSQIIFPKDDDDEERVFNLPTRLGQQNEQCYAPNRRQGYCVSINRCKNLLELLRKQAAYQLTYPELIFLRNSQCGEDETILVCCEPLQILQESAGPTKKPTKRPVIQSARPVSNLLPASSQCASIDDRIYGGKETELGEFPWMAMMEFTKVNGPPGHHCGGSLINNRYVVTAAHCVKKISKDWRVHAVRLGEHDTTTNPDCVSDLNNNQECAPPYVDITVEKAIAHEDYIPSSVEQLHDIALLRLSRPVEFNRYIKPICLPTSNRLQNSNLTGYGLEVAGWGRTEAGYSSTKKLKAVVDVVSLPSCNRVYSVKNVVLQPSQLCAGGAKGIDSCNGDSGGPLIGLDTSVRPNYFYLAGLVSFGPNPCGLEGWPGVYTKISSYVDWIANNIEP